MIAKQKIPSTESVMVQYELFEEKVALTPSGEEVTILDSIGLYSLEQLEKEKEYHEKAILDIQNKINAIQNIQ